jgi:catechol 2,3-dioxygenase-like lactoylglutathione lyase family enzyme
MISHVYSTTILVTDQDTALDFYVNKLGFEKRADVPMGPGAPRWIEVAPSGAQTVIVLATKDFSPDEETRRLFEGLVGKYNGLVFATDDLDATHKTLTERGVSFSTQPTREFWGYYAEVKDPDGNNLMLRQPV